MKYDIIRNEKLNEEVYFKELNNGLKVFFIPKKEYVKKYAIFTTKYGSNDNKFIPIGENQVIEVPEGIAHFLEHKLFEEPEGNIFSEFSKLGSYVNAFTNFNQTSYLFHCTDKFYKNLELLVKFVQTPYFTNENVEKEKGIIEQEIRMYDDSPQWKVFSNCLRGMYNTHPVRIDIAGTVDSINRIDKDTLYKCYNTFYHPSNMILVMVGNIDYEKSLGIISDALRRDLKEFSGEIKRVYTKEEVSINQRIVEEKLTVSTPLFNLGFKDIDVGYYGDKLLKKEIVTNILLEMLFGNSSEFYQSLYEEGLINSSFGTQYVGYKDYGHSILGGESEEPNKVMERVLEYIKRLDKQGLNNNDFNRIKKKMIGYHMIDLNSIEYIANKFTSYYLVNTFLTKYMDILEGIKYDDIIERFNDHFTESNYTLSIVKSK
ncbi:EF-P 5-aminopentanol modification-associated protein YfmH [Caldisalinibacter kiritimatiensis]|uniref:Peptidase, M16 family n=1 Tax=Caldisalinibacter kiritimatiensis TaxID=1304284 RepID=R1CG09_9FIRM|nr:pitrilysin family protein [Caldisalinibacter kiritimatiensis]EOD01250.1 Peptidase, M16 family [Caldisalinibacter kiritimatiensis]